MTGNLVNGQFGGGATAFADDADDVQFRQQEGKQFAARVAGIPVKLESTQS